MEGVTWLEVADARGALVGRARIDRLPFVVGRGYASDLLIDDPQVCPAHLRIAAGEEGLEIEDLGSVNGVWTETGERIGQRSIRAGDVVRLGTTTLRFRGPAEPVAATVPAGAIPPASAVAPAPRAGRGLLSRPDAAWPLAGLAAMTFTAQTYFSGYETVEPAEQVGSALAFLVGLAAYAGIWAFVSRVTTHRFSFRAHVAIGATGMLAFAALTLLGDYVAFLAPEDEVVGALVGLLMLVVAAIMLYQHLEYAAPFGARMRGIVTSVLIGGSVLLGVMSDWEEEFSPYPDFNAIVKPLGIGIAPLETADEFLDGAADLKEEVDEIAEEPLR